MDKIDQIIKAGKKNLILQAIEKESIGAFDIYCKNMLKNFVENVSINQSTRIMQVTEFISKNDEFKQSTQIFLAVIDIFHYVNFIESKAGKKLQWYSLINRLVKEENLFYHTNFTVTTKAIADGVVSRINGSSEFSFKNGDDIDSKGLGGSNTISIYCK
jgi:hypothetical protein